MSAQLNTVSGTIYEDFIVRMMGIKVSELTASIIMKCTVVVTGMICVALVMVVEKLNGILQVCVVKNRFSSFRRSLITLRFIKTIVLVFYRWR